MHYSKLTVVSFGLCLVFIVAACGKSEPPPAPRATAPAPVTPVTPPAAAPVTVSTLELGKQIGSDKRVTQPVTSFTPSDTIYVTVLTNGTAQSATLTAKWTYQDGQVVNESSQNISPTGPAATEFHISKPDGWPTGNYKVEVSLNGRSTATKEFEVKG